MTFEEAFESLVQETDLDILNAARHRVTYGKSQNSLVTWTMSEDWLNFEHDYPHRGNWNGAGVMTECSGEFDAR